MGLTSSRVRALNAVFEEGGFSAAARRLGISQPAVTQHIRELQSEFGVVLFERRQGSTVPTRICRDLYRITSEITQREDDAILLLRRERALDCGELRVGLGNAMPGMRIIGAFQRRYPNISVRVEMGTWATVIAGVEGQKLDVGILPEVPEDSRFRRVVCAEQDVVAMLHPDHPLAAFPVLGLQDLVGQPLIFRTPGSCTQRAVDAAFAAAGLSPRPVMTLDSRDGVIEAVVNGLGIGFIWRFGSSREDHLRRVTVRELSNNVEEHAFHLSHPVPPVAPQFMDVVRLNSRMH